MGSSKKLERIGQISTNNYGESMKITGYENANSITVEFENNNGVSEVTTAYSSFKTGDVKNPLRSKIYGRGYIGIGIYKPSVNGAITPHYQNWHSMMTRCYSEKFKNRNTSYDGCNVTQSWFDFQKFSEWHDANYYILDNEAVHLDKDILVKNNKLYSPDTCLYVPSKINRMLVRRTIERGDCPIGVHIDNGRRKKYLAQCRDTIKNKYINLGYYYNQIDAFYAYKEYKENTIKKVADLYKDKIPKILYDALYAYEVSIND